MSNNISEFLLSSNNMALMTIAFFFLVVIFFCFTEAYVYFGKKKRGIPYYGFKFTTKNIAYVSMMIVVSVSMTIVISMTAPITVFPPIRVAFTGIMIKITGLLFGPIVGILVGLITEILCLMFVPSYIHIAYFLVSIGFGFWSGLSGLTSKFKGKSKWWTFLIINAFTIGFGIVMYFITANYGQPTTLFGFGISEQLLPTIFIIVMGITLLCIWIPVLIIYLLKKDNWLDVVFPVILICIVTETLCTILIAPWADSAILGIPSRSNGYLSLVITRLLMMPVKIVFNTIVLTTVAVVMKPLIKNQ